MLTVVPDRSTRSVSSVTPLSFMTRTQSYRAADAIASGKATRVYVAVAAVLSTILAACSPPELDDQLDVESMPLVRTIDERFQSFQIGMSHLTGGDTWVAYEAMGDGETERDYAGDLAPIREPREPADLTNPRLRTLAAALGPFFVRYGGTTTNSVYFQDNDEPRLEEIPEGYEKLLTREAWKGGLEFAAAVDATVVTGFTVSEGVRDESGVWTPVHARPWLDYTKSVGGEIYAAEMFNEPNMAAYDEMLKDYDAARFARDFAAFHAFMKKAAPDVKLGGPGDVEVGLYKEGMPGSLTAEDYLSASPKPQFDILTYHYYGALSERCAPPDSERGISADKALSEDWLARQERSLERRTALRDQYAPGAPIWNTETGSAACGGTRWAPTFLDVFRYLDTNARLAKQGLDAIFTHALISGSNGVIDEKTFMPNANYWAALMWRRLMGTKVLDAGPIQSGLHVYAHCQRRNPEGVAVLVINLGETPAKISVPGPADLYVLTAPEPQSKTVLLNGKPLVLGPDDTLPEIAPQRLDDSRLTLAPTSVNFVVVPDAGNPACSI